MENEFLELIASTHNSHEDIQKLITFLKESDFFIAPASSKYHENYPHGLLEHSLKVYKNLKIKVDYYNNTHPDKTISDDTVIISALLHDVCKINYYKLEYRNVKDDYQWKKVPYYTVQDQFPYGHGEKSVYIINKYITLTDEEAFAIRWHMGGFEAKENYNYLSQAFSNYPLALLLHEADLEATYNIF